MAERSGREGPPAWATAFTSRFLEDLDFWIASDHRTAQRVTRLMKDVARDPFTGTGKPELLKHLGPGIWSRRITQEHRLLYSVEAQTITFLQARFHYT